MWSVAGLVVVAILGGLAYPGLMQRYRVSPNEIVKEKPYIDFNIRYTRLAYGLDNIEEREFPAEETLTPQHLRKAVIAGRFDRPDLRVARVRRR